MQDLILVGDIGATKSSWHLSTNPHSHFTLQGFNPVSQSSVYGQQLAYALKEQLKKLTPVTIWYYGAGIIGQEVSDFVKTIFADEFPDSTLIVRSDLDGAAFAACGSDPGAIAILGTGSHAALYDGHRITHQANSLGYILGDEGSGCDIGKALVAAYFYDQMPNTIRRKMSEILPANRKDFLTAMYSSPAPSQYLADFTKIAGLFQDHEWINQLIAERFKKFIHNHVKPLHPGSPVHILGSVGCIFASLIKQELSDAGLSAGDFIMDPSQRLFEMHLKNDNNK